MEAKKKIDSIVCIVSGRPASADRFLCLPVRIVLLSYLSATRLYDYYVCNFSSLFYFFSLCRMRSYCNGDTLPDKVKEIT